MGLLMFTLDSDNIGCMFGVLTATSASVFGFLFLATLENQSLGSTSGWRGADSGTAAKALVGVATAVY